VLNEIGFLTVELKNIKTAFTIKKHGSNMISSDFKIACSQLAVYMKAEIESIHNLCKMVPPDMYGLLTTGREWSILIAEPQVDSTGLSIRWGHTDPVHIDVNQALVSVEERSLVLKNLFYCGYKAKQNSEVVQHRRMNMHMEKPSTDSPGSRDDGSDGPRGGSRGGTGPRGGSRGSNTRNTDCSQRVTEEVVQDDNLRNGTRWGHDKCPDQIQKLNLRTQKENKFNNYSHQMDESKTTSNYIPLTTKALHMRDSKLEEKNIPPTRIGVLMKRISQLKRVAVLSTEELFENDEVDTTSC
jgi:hypothetical protein